MARLDDVTMALIKAEAAKAWGTWTKNEKTLVRFGMFPAERMAVLEETIGKGPGVGLALSCALMDCAKADGGMRA